MDRPNIEQELKDWEICHQRSTSSVFMFRCIVKFLLYLEEKIKYQPNKLRHIVEHPNPIECNLN